jgi:glc operon protein GlcG
VTKPLVIPVAVSLPVNKARQIVKAALEQGRRQQLAPLAVVVLDAGGHEIVFEREDGAGPLRFEIARGKAAGALGFGVSSRVIGERNQGRDAFLAAVAAASGGRFVPVAGGVLVLDAQGLAIGAVGVSGDTSDADEAVAIAGIEAAGLAAGTAPGA